MTDRRLLLHYFWKSVHSAKTNANHDYFNGFLKSKKDVESLLNDKGKQVSEANVLILGCGYNYPDVILWSTVAKQVVGVDVKDAFWKDGFGARYKN